ncbi:MAG: fructose-1,6-bisphosphatase [Methanospirillum sp.]|nr:fructose-1,6-bisphosphatase [Methanospirillum sp.]
MVTLREYLDGTGASHDLKDLIELIADQATPIRSAFISNQAYVGTENVSGEEQAAMDVWADRHMTRVLEASGLVKEFASEEQAEICRFPGARTNMGVVMDPLDGSSLVKVNLAVGTIVGIFDGPVLQPGDRLKAAFYLLYGPMTTLTLSVGEGVQVFAQAEGGAFHLLRENVRMPEGKLYGSGGGWPSWSSAHCRFIEGIERDGGKLRYSGAFVADFHQVLTYGGVYCYPCLPGKEGKLRLLFEANPMGFIARDAGGVCTDGEHLLLEVQPERVHQKVPIYIGSRSIICRLTDVCPVT